MHRYENDFSAKEKTEIQGSRIQKENAYCGRKKSDRSKTCKEMLFSEFLKKNSDFRNVYENGKSFADKYLVMYVWKNNRNINRLGISASKKVGNSVVRHRFARLVRESYRLHENIFNSGLDIVVVARKSAASAGYAEIERALLHLSKLHHMIKIYFYDEDN